MTTIVLIMAHMLLIMANMTITNGAIWTFMEIITSVIMMSHTTLSKMSKSLKIITRMSLVISTATTTRQMLTIILYGVTTTLILRIFITLKVLLMFTQDLVAQQNMTMSILNMVMITSLITCLHSQNTTIRLTMTSTTEDAAFKFQND